MARHLHIPALVLSTGMYACVVPPPLGLDQPDAGANAAPVIESVRGADGKELAQPGPVNVIERQGDATILVYDADVADTLFVRAFVDYTAQNPTAPRAQCTASPPTDATQRERTLQCTMKGLCNDADVTTGNPHFLTFEVYDRPVIDDPLLFRSVAAPGQKSQIDYLMTCLAP